MTAPLFDRSTTPYNSAFLSRPSHVDDAGGSPQMVYYEEHGRRDGVPAIYLHGGPGGGLARRGWTMLFDPEVWRLVGMDQRGCGLSTPLATDPEHDLDANTTGALIDDIEALRIELGIEQWIIYGVSWGTTLALAYARAFPERVRGMVLLAVTTTSHEEIDWITSGVRILFPEDHFELETTVDNLEAEVAALERHLSDGEGGTNDGHGGTNQGDGGATVRTDVVPRFIERVARLVQYPDASVRQRAIEAWARWEAAHVTIGQPREPGTVPVSDRADFVTLTTHYWAHDAFLDVPLLADLGGAQNIETHLIHGRLDVSGPVWAAWRLSRLMPNSHLTIVESERHGGEQMMAVAAEALAGLAISDEPSSPGTPIIVEN